MKKVLLLLLIASSLIVGNLIVGNFGKEVKADQQSNIDKGNNAHKNGDYEMAFNLLEPLAKQGSAQAQNNLGAMYSNGQGVLKDYKKAVYWYRKAAEQGHAIAQFNLGFQYDNGQGVLKDYRKAAYWYQKAAEQGYAQAQYDLGVMCYNGHGVLKDYRKAVYWYQKAAEQGYAQAQNNLGAMYCFGVGTLKNFRQCAYWAKKAIDNGSDESSKLWNHFELWKYQNSDELESREKTLTMFYGTSIDEHTCMRVKQFSKGIILEEECKSKLESANSTCKSLIRETVPKRISKEQGILMIDIMMTCPFSKIMNYPYEIINGKPSVGIPE